MIVTIITRHHFLISRFSLVLLNLLRKFKFLSNVQDCSKCIFSSFKK